MLMTTDKDALVASQIAYMDIDEDCIENAIRDYGTPTLGNILAANKSVRQGYIRRVTNGKDPETVTYQSYINQLQNELANLNK